MQGLWPHWFWCDRRHAKTEASWRTRATLELDMQMNLQGLHKNRPFCRAFETLCAARVEGVRLDGAGSCTDQSSEEAKGPRGRPPERSHYVSDNDAARCATEGELPQNAGKEPASISRPGWNYKKFWDSTAKAKQPIHRVQFLFFFFVVEKLWNYSLC